MKTKISGEEILFYLKNKRNKELKARAEVNEINNNILKKITVPTTLSNLSSHHFQNINFKHNCNNFLYTQTKSNSNYSNSKNDNKSFSKVLILKKINYNQNYLDLFKKKNSVKIDMIKKYLNIKKKKYNKGKDFSSYFLQQRQDYYINTLNQGLVNSFISFYINAEKYYTNYNNNNEIIQDDNLINNNILKIYNIEYPIFNIKLLKRNNFNFFINNDSKKIIDKNIYDKCCEIYGMINYNNNENNHMKENSYFLQGWNHNIRYDLENYISNKIHLIELDDYNNSLLFENKNYITKYSFQFIKISNNKNISIDVKNIIFDKKLKYSFNEPRIMYPLFLNGMFDNINIFKHCSFFKNQNIENNNTKLNLNLIFQKNIDRFHDLNNTQFGEEFINSEESFNILNGKYLENPFQISINNKQLIQETKMIFKPKKLISSFQDIIGGKSKIKFRQKRNYLNIINNDIQNKIKKEEKKLIIVNSKNVGKLLNNKNEYIIMDNIEEGLDFLFDINICGKIFLSTEFLDEFEYNGYNNLIDLINRNYLYYSKFYIFIINDEQLNKKENYSLNKIINTINQIINNKFLYIINNTNYHFNVIIKVISNPHLINYEINNIYEELIANNYNDILSIYNRNIFDRIINDIKINDKIQNNEIMINVNNKTNYNRYENYILNMIQDEELKIEIQKMINHKYSKRNII